MNTPLKLSTTPDWSRGLAPLLDQHCDELLNWLGYSSTQIAELRKKNA
ncbi:MAG: hypothetical protein SVW57_05805 [Thermodesulfobacteriota bacterium]|nr:hypothetical protein [Thermodesulfobacteriota bacterium]